VTVHLPMAIHPGFGNASYDAILHDILTRKRRLSQDLFIPAEIGAADFPTGETGHSGDSDGKGDPTEPDLLSRIDARGPLHLEEWVVATCRRKGLNVVTTPRTGDGGADVVVRGPDGRPTHLIQCKHTTSVRKPVDGGILGDAMRVRANWAAPDAIFVGVTNGVTFTREVRRVLVGPDNILVERASLPRIGRILRPSD